MRKQHGKTTKVCPQCMSSVAGESKKCRYCQEPFKWYAKLAQNIRVYVDVLSIITAFIGVCIAIQQYKGRNLAEKTLIATNQDVQSSGKGLLKQDEPLMIIGPQEEKDIVARNFRDADSRVKDVIKRAFALKNDSHIPFVWGGKSPEKGFDSSGFAAYLLSRVGVLDKVGYVAYSSIKLKESFTSVSLDDMKPGDLIIFQKGFVAFNLGDRKVMGIGSDKGIQVLGLRPDVIDTIVRWY